MARHKVGEVSQGLRCVSIRSDVDVNACTNSGVGNRSGFSEFAYQFLQGFNVLVFQNRCDQFALFGIASCNADILLKFPFSVLCIPSRPSAVAVSVCRVLVASCSEKVGCELCSVLSGDVVHLNLHADGLLFQVFDLLCGFFVHGIFLRNFGLFALSLYTY